MDESGRRVRGVLLALDERTAFESLKREGLSPVRLRIRSAVVARASRGRARISDENLGALLFDLGALLQAGADIRTALNVLSGRADRSSTSAGVKAIAAEISSGATLDAALSKVLGGHGTFVAALAAAGEASGDLAAALIRAGELIDRRLALRRQLISALSYPTFVLISTVMAVLVILLFVAPSLAPLAESPGVTPPMSMRILLTSSELLKAHGAQAAGGFLGAVLGLIVGHRLGLLNSVTDRIVLDGVFRRTFGAMTYGAFAVALGELLVAGTPISEALALSVRTVRLGLARSRLEVCVDAVRQGERLSASLDRIKAFPDSIIRLAEIGEEASVLGVMLQRAGGMEQAKAVKRVEAFSQVLGPTLIVLLGALIGLLMAGLLSGVTGLGAAALN